MKVLVDESIPRVTMERLRPLGHEHAMGRFHEAEWPGLLVLMRDTTMSTSRAGASVEKWSGGTRVTP